MIGGRDGEPNIAPVIGDDVTIGAGARILGDVRIGNGATIGANAVVTRDIPPGATVVRRRSHHRYRSQFGDETASRRLKVTAIPAPPRRNTAA